jgi:DNA-binding transcriptional LysR family regulator
MGGVLLFGDTVQCARGMKQNFTVRAGALDGVEAFLAVARRRSFRRAAADLGVSASAISQAVRGLEGRIGAALFARTTRSVGLTEAGQRFLERAGPALEELAEAALAARALGAGPAGRLRLTAPAASVPLLLQPMLASFCAAHPAVELEIAVSETLVDLARDGFDAGVRMGQFIEADMVAVRLTPPFRFEVVGSPAYLQARGEPARPEALRGHACLRLRRSAGAIAPWRFEEGNRALEVAVAGPLIANDFPTLLGAAEAALGLAQVPEPLTWEAVRSGALRPVLREFAPMTPGMFLYYPGRRQALPKLRAFIEHAKGFAGRGWIGQG